MATTRKPIAPIGYMTRQEAMACFKITMKQFRYLEFKYGIPKEVYKGANIYKLEDLNNMLEAEISSSNGKKRKKDLRVLRKEFRAYKNSGYF